MGISQASLAAAIALSALVPPALSAAATYTYNFTIDPSTLTCGRAGDIKYCYQYEGAAPATDNPGDVYNINVTFTKRLTIGGSKTLSQVFAGVYDTRALFGGTDYPDAEESGTASVSGYMGPPGLIQGGTDVFNDGYYGSSGFYSPNPGFSITGFSTSLDVITKDQYPLVQLIVATQVGVPEPGAWVMLLAGFAGVGVAVRTMRRREAAAA